MIEVPQPALRVEQFEIELQRALRAVGRDERSTPEELAQVLESWADHLDDATAAAEALGTSTPQNPWDVMASALRAATSKSAPDDGDSAN